MSERLTLTVKDKHKEFLDANKRLSPSGIMQDAIDMIMNGEWKLNIDIEE